MDIKEVEEQALARGILPLRYLRNLDTIDVSEQHSLFNARVAVVGCGGLGGHVIEQLARLGVGSITAWDYDVFEEHNLNRQIYSQIENLGQSKVAITARRVRAVNPAVRFNGFHRKFDESSRGNLQGMQVVVDALDNIPARLILSSMCGDMGIPLVHGAVGAWYGQVCTQFPGDNVIERLYREACAEKGAEIQQGILGFIPAVIAGLQVAETVKILLGRGELLRHKVMFINLLDMEFDVMEFPAEEQPD